MSPWQGLHLPITVLSWHDQYVSHTFSMIVWSSLLAANARVNCVRARPVLLMRESILAQVTLETATEV